MKQKFLFFSFLFLIFSLYSCFNNGYDDGTYCAEVDYYNEHTGTKSTYTLEVEIEDNKLIIIYWPNGGWLDESHFIPPDISDGRARFLSDKGYEYTVTILDEEDCNLDDTGPEEEVSDTDDTTLEEYETQDSNEDESQELNEDEICPVCGNEKYSWEELCENCKMGTYYDN